MLNPVIPNSEEQKAAFHQSGMDLLNALYDTLSSLGTKVRDMAKTSTDEEYKKSVEQFTKFEDEVAGILDENLDIQFMLRNVRPQDIKGIAIGEHAGFSIQYIDAKNKTTLLINCHGGLRDVNHAADNRDNMYGNTHAERTINTISKPTQMNIHLIPHGKTDPLYDCWVTADSKKISLYSFLIEKQKMDMPASIYQDVDPHTYTQLSSGLSTSVKSITAFVDNPFSPR